ncbi:polyphosphate kinase 1 [Foetidibacter luteolus]|uniref:polyphosphate kinase 1 n=1 Tax=Foetidibacter luteolus TaxID=2608880 RepID=UPI00129BD12D|nr:polyphosphate kinase 1 [Foetidibacter luteolus]
MQQYLFFSRDISWLGFNGRVLQEAANSSAPLFERIKFLSIYSSNLDEFYRVRFPVLMALANVPKPGEEVTDHRGILNEASQLIARQLDEFGRILQEDLLPGLKRHNIHLIYKEPVPGFLTGAVTDYFYTHVLAFLQPLWLRDYSRKFFPENNKLYLLVVLTGADGAEETAIINIPSDALPRFISLPYNGTQYILFLDDVLKLNLANIFKHYTVTGSYSFKITRDAELELQDEYEGDLAEKIENQIEKRDLGLATRFLYEPGAATRTIFNLAQTLGITSSNMVQGGSYHNLKDLSSLPIGTYKELSYQSWPSVSPKDFNTGLSIFDTIKNRDVILHIPYHSYNPVLRFFNEAAIDADTEEIYVTLYRVASDSRIANALISAARNGKKVTVFVELKARFDEANNLKWSKRMKAAGVKIIYSIPGLKVHAKVALVKKKNNNRTEYFGLLATGNFNEGTARFYTDHILFTANPNLVRELEMLFIFLGYRQHADKYPALQFNHLLVAQFNLQQTFLFLIDREMQHAQRGKPAHIIIKLNNLEEKRMITKLYDASNAGVKVQLMVRSICRLIPGVPGMSENITVTRIVDRYLEHGRIFIFHNNGDTELFMGSADWMNRNIYRRIEVCFPVLDATIKQQLMEIVQLQLNDNVQAVQLNQSGENTEVTNNLPPIASQQEIYNYVKALQA